MSNLEFITGEEWNLAGSNKKQIYFSLVAKIDGWKKSIIFYEEKCSPDLWEVLLKIGKEKKIDWELAVETQRTHMNSIFVQEVYRVFDENKNLIWPIEKEPKQILKEKETELKKLEAEIKELKINTDKT